MHALCLLDTLICFEPNFLSDDTPGFAWSGEPFQPHTLPIAACLAGARREDLVPSRLQDRTTCRPPLPDVTFVFAEVPGAHSLAHRQHKAELHVLNKAIKRCMLQVMACLPGGDGYMCRCHEADLRFMVAFESPVRAVEWCLLVQVGGWGSGWVGGWMGQVLL